MRRFTVMEPPPSGNAARDADRVVFVREGFSWIALFVPALWLLFTRQWLALIACVALEIALGVFGARVSDDAGAVLSLAVNIVIAFEAPGLLRWQLARRGFREVAVLEAPGRLAAEQRYFSARPAAPAPARRRAVPLPEAGEPVLGLFPRPERLT